MPTSRSKRLRHPAPRILLWLAALLVAVLGIPLGAFLLWNAIDEAPSRTALRYATPPPDEVADAENAWLLMAGLGAPEEADPIAWARGRVEVWNASVSHASAQTGGAQPAVLAQDAVPAVKPELTVHGFGSHCPQRAVDCVAWAREHRRELEQLGDANRLRLQRYLHAQSLPRWRDLYMPTLESPFIDVSVSSLHLDLIGLRLAEAGDSTQRAAALEMLAGEVAFWRRVRAQPQNLFGLLLAARRIEDVHWLLGAWFDHVDASVLAEQSTLIERILAEPGEQPDWGAALDYKFHWFDGIGRENMHSLGSVLWRCAAGPPIEEGCLYTLAVNATYAHQATLNLHALNFAQIERVLNAAPEELAQVEAAAGADIDSRMPLPQETSKLLGQALYNFSGRVFAALALPAFDWGRREHDREALRRMVQIKHQLRTAQVTQQDAEAFVGALQEKRPDLRNPIDGSRFGFDPQLSVLGFSPLAAKYWKRNSVYLDVPARRRNGVFACPAALRFALAELKGDEIRAVRTYETCSEGGIATQLGAPDGDASIPVPAEPRMLAVRADLQQGRLGVRAEYVDGEVYVFRGVLEPGAEPAQIRLTPDRDDAPLALVLRRLAEPARQRVAVKVSGVSMRDLGLEIARVSNLRLDGARCLPTEVVDYDVEVPVEPALSALGGVYSCELERVGPRHYRFRPPRTPSPSHPIPDLDQVGSGRQAQR